MAGDVRRAYDRSVRAAKKEEGDTNLTADLDAALVAAGRNIADHLDAASAQLENAIARAVELVEQEMASADPDMVAVARALEAVDKVSERSGKAVYLTPHFMNILREMYATPKARAELIKATEKAKADAKKAGGGSHLQGLKGGRAG